jgi:hypothetical protein
MGWWKCNNRGGIDWENKPGGLLNAIPDRDTTEDYYNGDRPADFMEGTCEVIRLWFKDRKEKPTTENLIDLFVNNKVDKVFNFINPEKLKNLVNNTWLGIDDIYEDDWGRPTYKQEKFYVCNFVFSGMWEDD